MESLDTDTINQYFRKFSRLESDLENLKVDVSKLKKDTKLLVSNYDHSKYNHYEKAAIKITNALSIINQDFISQVKNLNDLMIESYFFEHLINNIADTIFIQHKKIQNIKLLLLKYKCQNEPIDSNDVDHQEINNTILDTIILNLKFVKDDIPYHNLTINKYDKLKHFVIIVEIYRKKYNQYKEQIKGKEIDPHILLKMMTIDTLFKTVNFF